MFTAVVTSLMESWLATTDIGLKLTKTFKGNILLIGGGSNEITKQLCESLLNFAPESKIYHFNHGNQTHLGEKYIKNGYKYIRCNLSHANGFTNAINILNKQEEVGSIQFDYFINSTLLTPSAKRNLFLNANVFQGRFNESLINIMKAMKYVLETHPTGNVYMINFSIPYTADLSYQKIDYLVCSNSINQFHDSLSSEIEGKCLLIYLPTTRTNHLPINKIMKCLKEGCNGEYHIKSPGINSIFNETFELLHDWV